MAYDYQRLAQKASRLLGKFGRTLTLVQPGAVSGPSWSPTFGQPVETLVTAVEVQGEERAPDGRVIVVRRFVFAPPVGVVVSEGDRIRDGGEELEIEAVERVSPGNTDVVLVARVRHG